MEFKNGMAQIFVPDGANEADALGRTTHLCIAAHQDDIELMAYPAIAECFGVPDKWFTGVVVSDGAGSPRSGIYGDYSDDQMKSVRAVEQNKAAFIGDYSAMLQLGYTSKDIKDSNNNSIVNEILKLIRETKPKYIFTHNPADKHDTHIGVATKVIRAIRLLKPSERPLKVYGLEVWRDLDWVNEDMKVVFDASSRPNIATSLVGVFDSQICGGKRYDLAAIGRRTANATYAASHGCDEFSGISNGIDMTELMENDMISVEDYILKYINAFKQDVLNRLAKING